MNGEPEVARRVLEYGLSQHEAYVSEPEYVLHYVDFLIQVSSAASSFLRREGRERLRRFLGCFYMF